MLRKIRIAVAAFFIVALTLLFLDYTGTLHRYLGWSARIQLLPAVLAGNIAVAVGLVVATLLLGRAYCSAICPLGIFQDVVSRIAGIGKRDRFSYRPPKKPLVILRYGILAAVIVVCIIIGVGAAVIDPYSLYGKMVSQILVPLYKWGNNILAGFAERSGSYAFYRTDIWLTGAVALSAAILTLAVIGVFAFKSGRGYCNTLCPVGAFLSVFVRFSPYAPPVNKEKCTSCGLCAKNCKAGCIDPVKKEIDMLRCVSCCNCLELCPSGAITLSLRNPFGAKKSISNVKPEPVALANDGLARRGFVSGAVLLALGLIARPAARAFDGGLTPLKDKKAPVRSNPIIPPGADNARSFGKHCTGCQLCVSVCPNQVLRPSSKISDLLHPRLSYERGYCRPECVKCSEVCPSGAIRPITAAEKSATQIGIAAWNKDLCIINTDKVKCTLCERKCPTGAITMISQSADDMTSPKIPMVDANRCVGCGACENLCPARPYSAIVVNGVESHRTV
ncbi:MAG: 4Fe-4S binding protein [Chitinispirillales bacterium]|jgi:polyferredoxin|nr:4Fe-4S binding protein [Chitinispirillales bacterium]